LKNVQHQTHWWLAKICKYYNILPHLRRYYSSSKLLKKKTLSFSLQRIDSHRLAKMTNKDDGLSLEFHCSWVEDEFGFRWQKWWFRWGSATMGHKNGDLWLKKKKKEAKVMFLFLNFAWSSFFVSGLFIKKTKFMYKTELKFRNKNNSLTKKNMTFVICGGQACWVYIMWFCKNKQEEEEICHS
jgi:hypothetical protein